MNRRKIRKIGYQEIVKNGKSHQETFNELRLTNETKVDELSVELSKIPSSGKTKATTSLRYIFIAALILIFIIRVLGTINLNTQFGNNPTLLIILLVTGVIIPILGVFAALTSRSHLYYGIGMLLAINLFKSFTRQDVTLDTSVLIILIPFVVAIILAFYIPIKLKTSFTRTVSKEMIDGKEMIFKKIVFEDSRISSDDILDSFE